MTEAQTYNDAHCFAFDRHTSYLVLNAVKTTGSYDPDESMFLFEEQLTPREARNIRAFMTWVHLTGRKFGTANLSSTYQEFLKSLN